MTTCSLLWFPKNLDTHTNSVALVSVFLTIRDFVSGRKKDSRAFIGQSVISRWSYCFCVTKRFNKAEGVWATTATVTTSRVSVGKRVKRMMMMITLVKVVVVMVKEGRKEKGWTEGNKRQQKKSYFCVNRGCKDDDDY